MESFEQIAVQYTPMIYSIIRKLNIYKNKDEFFQTGLIALWEAHQRVDSEKGTFTSYAYSYIHGKILTELSRSKRNEERTAYPKEEFWELIVSDAHTSLLEEDILVSYCQRGQLTENQTKWVLYSFLKGFNINEIAEIEHLSLSALKNWRNGAKEKLRKTALLTEK